MRAVRGLGLLACAELDVSVDRMTRLFDALNARHVYAHGRVGDRWLILAPPLNIPEADLQAGLDAVRDAANEALS